MVQEITDSNLKSLLAEGKPLVGHRGAVRAK